MSGPAITVPTGIIAAITAETWAYGRRLLETGGFLLSRTGSNVATGVAFAGDVGIERGDRFLQISERALDRLFVHADENGLWIPAQFHSHRFRRIPVRHGRAARAPGRGVRVRGDSALRATADRPGPVGMLAVPARCLAAVRTVGHRRRRTGIPRRVRRGWRP
jgi:hypothetical protein